MNLAKIDERIKNLKNKRFWSKCEKEYILTDLEEVIFFLRRQKQTNPSRIERGEKA